MSDDNDGPIDRALGLPPIPYEKNSQIVDLVAKARDDSAKEDFTFSRANVRTILETGSEAIEKLALLADQSQNPRAYEVLAKLIDTVSNASKQLMDLQVQLRTIEKVDMPHDDEARKHVTNNLFVGSTAELQRMIADINKDK